MLRLLGILALCSLIFGNGHHRRGFSGGLLLLPALMFGGWIAIAVIGGVFGLIGSVIGGIFSGLASLTSGVFSADGIALGVIIGVIAYFWFRNRKNRSEQAEE